VSIVQLPLRLWARPNIPEFGRAVHIRFESHVLLPGEAITTIHAKGPAPRAGSALKPSTKITPSQTRILNVPEGLRSRTRLEVSGAVWIPDLNESLVISDDTGLPGGTEDLPWVFWVDVNGNVSPKHSLIEGVEKISDLESVAMDQKGRLYFLCSQSMSKRGKRPQKRQYIVRAERTDKRLVATGVQPLYTYLKEHLSTKQWADLDIDDNLDIEGMTWWRNGLLLGLKTPLEKNGRARLWHLKNPGALFDKRPPGQADLDLQVIADISLPTGADGQAGGISELLADGDTLFILSTVADGAPVGAAWRIRGTPTNATPIKVAEWEGLKPEALAKISGERLLVFFDRGAEKPMMTTLTTSSE
jgi:hypothetical protein